MKVANTFLFLNNGAQGTVLSGVGFVANPQVCMSSIVAAGVYEIRKWFWHDIYWHYVDTRLHRIC